MAKTKTTKMKRILAVALHNQERAAQGLALLHDIFEPTHEEHAQYLAALIKNQLQLQEMALKFWEFCWGKRPKDFNTWR